MAVCSRSLLAACVVVAAAALKPPAMALQPPAMPRRQLFGAAALTLGAPSVVPVVAAAEATSFAVQAERVPVFLITTPDGSTPLFTDSSSAKGALDVAKLFAQRGDAERRLKQLKLKADEAAVMSLPLAEALDLRRRPASEVGGTFVFEANRGERDDASAIAKVDVEKDDIPLFFDPRLAQKGEGGAVFLFTKKSDLDAAWLRAAGGRLRDVGYPNYRVTSVRSLAEKPVAKDAPPILLSSSEAF